MHTKTRPRLIQLPLHNWAHWQGYVDSTLRVGCITRASQISRQESHTSCCCGSNSTPDALAYHLLTLSPILHFASHRFVLDLLISAPDARYRVIRVTGGSEAPHAHSLNCCTAPLHTCCPAPVMHSSTPCMQWTASVPCQFRLVHVTGAQQTGSLPPSVHTRCPSLYRSAIGSSVMGLAP